MIKKLLFTALPLLGAVSMFAQVSPGGVSGQCKMWLKANTGVTLSSTNTVTTWAEQSGAGILGDFSTQGAAINKPTHTAPSYLANGINFNPYIVFNNTATPNSISSNNAVAGTQILDGYNNTLFQVIKLHTMTVTGVWLKWQWSTTPYSGPRIGDEVNNGGANTGKMRLDFRSTLISNSVIAENHTLATGIMGQSANTIRINGATDNTISTASQAAFAPGTNQSRFTLGAEPYGDDYPCKIDIAEEILYSRTLTAAERNKVESYLAVKYGITLDQGSTNANDYTSSNGTITWNRANNLPFSNNITGIGRDDNSGLDQRQSKSINAAGIITAYYGSYNGTNFPVLNTDNTNAFTADGSFMIFGDNGQTTTLSRCYNLGSAGFLRMNRVWKAQITGTINTFTLAVKTSDVPAGTKNLLVSTDSTFTTANTTVYNLDNYNSILSKSITVPNNFYFTYAGDSLLAVPSSNSPLCVGSTIQLSAAVNGGSGTPSFSWTGPNGFTSNLQNPTITNAQTSSSGAYTLSGTVSGCPLLPASVNVLVSIKPAPPVTVTPVVYCMGDQALPLTAIGQNLNWYYAPTGGVGSATAPVPSTAYEDTTTYWVTQSNNGCESIRTKLDVFVYTKPNGIIVGSRNEICQGDTMQVWEFGNGTPDMQYDWKVPFKAGTILGGSGQGPLTIRFDSAGTYNVRMQINNKGCVSPERNFAVKVKASPVVRTNIKSDACQDEVVTVSLGYTTPGVDNYAWNFDGGVVQYGSFDGGPYGVTWNTPGLHVVSLVATAAACPAAPYKDSIIIHSKPFGNIVNLSATEICSGDTVHAEALDVASGNTYTWSPALFFGDNEHKGPASMAVFTQPAFMKLAVTNEWGCTDSGSVYINAKPCCEVYFPTAFSPNKDGRNDIFHVITVGHHKISNFRVVNRWGQTVFETDDETRGWDGTMNGTEQPIGTYYYYIKYRCANNEYMEQKGEVTLVR